MNAWFRQIVLRLNASYWFLPALLTLGAVLLSFVTYFVDLKLGSGWVEHFGWIHDSRPDGARSLLSTIAGSMISVAGTVFAITIAAVVYASGNYGPRLLTNFMTDRGNQLSLGVFIATFVYCLLVLRTIRQPDETGVIMGGPTGGFVPELSVVTALLLALLSVGVLVYFLHHVPASIRINSVVARIGNRMLHDIDARYPRAHEGRKLPEPPEMAGISVRAERAGYIQVVDFATLRRCCDDSEVSVRLEVRPGEFVHPQIVLLTLAGAEACDETQLEKLTKGLRGAFAIGESRTSSQDIEFAMDELAEIALRALSPGINDPFTAITCLSWLSAALARIASRDLDADADGEPYGESGVHAPADSFGHFVEHSFGAVRHSAASNPMAAVAFIKAVEAAGAGDPAAERIGRLRRETALLVDQAETVLKGPALAEVRDAARGGRPE